MRILQKKGGLRPNPCVLALAGGVIKPKEDKAYANMFTPFI